MLDIKQIEMAVNVISAEKKIPKEKLIEIIEAAIKTAYKKDYGKRHSEENNQDSGESGVVRGKDTSVQQIRIPGFDDTKSGAGGFH